VSGPEQLTSVIPDERITNKVLIIRGVKILLDSDLAELYGTETKVLNQSVTRNQDRFPSDFMFRLTTDEFKFLRSQSVTLEGRGKFSKHPPRAFTEQGVAMLSSVLKSKRAVQVNIQIIRIFTRLRQILSSSTETQNKIQQMDQDIKSIYKILEQLMVEEQTPKPKIGFRMDNEA